VERILFLSHTESDGTLPRTAHEVLRGTVDLAGALGAELIVGLLGREVEAAADGIAACGAVRFLGVAGEHFAVSRYATDVAAARCSGLMTTEDHGLFCGHVHGHARHRVVLPPREPRLGALVGRAEGDLVEVEIEILAGLGIDPRRRPCDQQRCDREGNPGKHRQYPM